MRKTIVHGHDNEGYSRLGNKSKANKSLQGAYGDRHHFGIASSATDEDRLEVIGMTT